MLRVKIHKLSAEGEQIDVEIDVPRAEAGELDGYLMPAFALVDRRLAEMNHRLLEAFKVLQHFPPELRGAIKVLLDALHHGRYDQLGTIPQLVQQAKGNPMADVESPNG